MQPEVYFLKYAFPCSQAIKDIRKTITEQDYELIKDAAINEKVLPREYLEKVFTMAVKRIKEINDNVWDTEAIRKYFQEDHNDVISKDLPPMIQRLCKVEKGKVTNIIDGIIVVDLGDESRNVHALYKNPKIGDSVFIHYGYAVEKV